jgi:uncharacterized protein
MESSYSLDKVATQFMYKVYGWMAGGLAVTAITAYFARYTQFASLFQRGNTGLMLILFLIQIGLVFFLSFFLQRLSYTMASIAFLVYAVITGLIFSTLFLVFTETSIASTFIITASMFAVLAFYGYYTQSDLTSMGNILMMALIGLIVGLLVNLFLRSSSFNFILSALGVLIFAGLTAYDVQRIKRISYQLLNAGNLEGRVAILGALTLYLDFINLFLMLLNFTGKRRE